MQAVVLSEMAVAIVVAVNEAAMVGHIAGSIVHEYGTRSLTEVGIAETNGTCCVCGARERGYRVRRGRENWDKGVSERMDGVERDQLCTIVVLQNVDTVSAVLCSILHTQ